MIVELQKKQMLKTVFCKAILTFIKYQSKRKKNICRIVNYYLLKSYLITQWFLN